MPHPRSSAGSRRLVPLNTPTPVQVRAHEDGAPAEVRLEHRPTRVIEIQERWRIDDEWWRKTLCRRYYRVVLHDGRILTLYHDLESGDWFLQR